ncbi:GNAT family N-acetyltransferase [Bifidobacterium sp.]|jgi:ribosomal protein S18 acetylase RimI-like enzyme|uniref:GNAT family N-acetyltransferase n=1 Tax=Bifidobacterium sp. TaxID=41200 RepID=UPI0025C424FF|nr:GNAT family N-acetyltransferase [Bifidobacterium sp.]MCI1636209.1 GNAT family N-acetyltransferase [Bifidobacterium sp.]
MGLQGSNKTGDEVASKSVAQEKDKPQTVNIRRMVPEDYDASYALWSRTPGMHLHSLNNTYGGISEVILHNPDSSFVAFDESGGIVGTAIGATDGRKGYIYHLAVDEHFRGHGIGTRLVARIRDVLQAKGIEKIGVFIVNDNIQGQQFWGAQGWNPRSDVTYWDIDL